MTGGSRDARGAVRMLWPVRVEWPTDAALETTSTESGDALSLLLEHEEYQEGLLLNYVAGVGSK